MLAETESKLRVKQILFMNNFISNKLYLFISIAYVFIFIADVL